MVCCDDLKGRCLTFADRDEMAILRAQGRSLRQIAAVIGRAASIDWMRTGYPGPMFCGGFASAERNLCVRVRVHRVPLRKAAQLVRAVTARLLHRRHFAAGGGCQGHGGAPQVRTRVEDPRI